MSEHESGVRRQLTRTLDNLDHNGLLLLLLAISRDPEGVSGIMFDILVERLPTEDALPPQVLEAVVEIVRGLSYHDLSFLAVSLRSSQGREVVGLMSDELHRRIEENR